MLTNSSVCCCPTKKPVKFHVDALRRDRTRDSWLHLSVCPRSVPLYLLPRAHSLRLKSSPQGSSSYQSGSRGVALVQLIPAVVSTSSLMTAQAAHERTLLVLFAPEATLGAPYARRIVVQAGLAVFEEDKLSGEELEEAGLDLGLGTGDGQPTSDVDASTEVHTAWIVEGPNATAAMKALRAGRRVLALTARHHRG